MRRLFSFCTAAVLAVFCLTGLAACTGRNGADVHVFYYSYSDTYISTVRSALDRKLSAAGIAYQDYDGNSNQTTQTEQIQTAITKGARMIVVNVVTTGSDEAAASIVNMAKNAKIPVVFFNREVSDKVVNSYDRCAFVGTDAAEAGHMQGEMIGEYVRDHFSEVDRNGDGQISYVCFMGEKGNSEAIYRTRYGVEDADAVLSAAGLKPLVFYDAANSDRYLVDRDGKWSAAAANEYMTTIFTAYNDANNNMVELVICNNDGMAEGAVSALNTIGYNLPGGDKFIPVFGVDATDAAKNLIAKGSMVGTIRQDSDGMAQALTTLIENGLAGEALLKNTGIYTVDDHAAKIRIAYAKYLGE